MVRAHTQQIDDVETCTVQETGKPNETPVLLDVLSLKLNGKQLVLNGDSAFSSLRPCRRHKCSISWEGGETPHVTLLQNVSNADFYFQRLLWRRSDVGFFFLSLT